MYIIVVGQGKLGATVTKQLANEGHDIVVVDTKNDVVSKIVDTYDVMGICGNGATVDILEEAGAKKAKLIVACTPSDEINILCCMFAKKLGTENAIARVRNPGYASQSQFLREKIGINMIVNPEFEMANEISRIIRFPSAVSLDSFVRGKVETAGVVIKEGNPVCGMQISEIRKKIKAKVLICAVQRGEKVFIPSGDFTIEANDSVYITGIRAELSAFLRQTGIHTQKIKNVMIIGGGGIGYYLADLLSDTGRNVTIIDSNEQRCIELNDMLEDATIIHGDGTDQDILDELGIDSQDALVALTGIDEENIIVSMYARSKNVKKVITKIDRHSYSILNEIGLDTKVSPQLVAGSLVTRYVRALQNSADNSKILTLYRLIGGKVEAVEFRVPENAGYENIPFKDLKLLPNILICCLIRNGKIIFPDGSDVMKSGDNVIVVTTGRILEDLHDIFI